MPASLCPRTHREHRKEISLFWAPLAGLPAPGRSDPASVSKFAILSSTLKSQSLGIYGDLALSPPPLYWHQTSKAFSVRLPLSCRPAQEMQQQLPFGEHLIDYVLLYPLRVTGEGGCFKSHFTDAHTEAKSAYLRLYRQNPNPRLACMTTSL